MSFAAKRVLNAALVIIAFGTILGLASCSRTLPYGAIGNEGHYNYSPSIIENGELRQIWWCGQGVDPNNTSQDTDAIYYESVDLKTNRTFGPKIVLGGTPGTWDSALVCNPKVIGGVFANPLGDGQTYTFAMYYVGTTTGIDNSIGVAFSNDGLNWKKYPQPVVVPQVQGTYGVGQPALYNADHKSAITLFYEDWDQTITHVASVSTDGVNFNYQGALTTNGMDPDDPDPIWGDIAFDSVTSEWYAVFCRPLRPPSTTGGVIERGQYGVELYKISKAALLTGSSPWQQLAIMDTNLTGFESNFIAGFVRDPFGNVNVAAYPKIQMYTSVSYPAPDWSATPADAGLSARIETWILLPMEWSPGTDSVALNRYYNGKIHEVTTGWIGQDARFHLETLLGHIYANALQGATVPLYGCKSEQTDYFVSLDSACEGQRVLGTEGYAYSAPNSGLNLTPLYRCYTGHDHFVSHDPNCEGATTEKLLGYAAP